MPLSGGKIQFKPAKYGAQTINQRRLPNSRGIPKGATGVAKIDVNKLETLVNDLRNYSDVHISQLSDDIKKKFDKLVGYVGLLHNTPSYDVLRASINLKFKDLEHVTPGTVGAYCMGCYAKDSFGGDEKTCSPLCAGSMPTGDKWNGCPSTVVMTSYDNDEYTFHVTKGKDTDLAYIYVNSPNYNVFPGFSDKEKVDLYNSWGIRTVRLYGYHYGSYKYTRLHKDDLPLDQIKCRVSIISTTNNSDQFFGGAGIFIFLVILVLIGFFIFWRNRGYYRRP